MILAFEDCELDFDRYELRRAGDRVAIEPQVFDVLAHLAANADRVVPKEELLDTVWGDRFVSESALTSRIKAARRAVGDDGTRQAVIATAHGRGYRLVAPVAARGGPRAQDATAQAAPASPSTTLLERDAPLDELRRALAAARDGSGRLVWIAGEAGVGKSSLVRSFADEVGDRAPVFLTGCDDLLTPRPSGPIRDLVDRLRDDGQRALDDEPNAGTVARALAEAGSGRGCAVVIEDLHWADDATLDVIRQLGTRVRELPAVLVLTYRDEDVQLTHPLRKLLGTIRGPHVAYIALEPLHEESVASLVEGSGKDATEVFAATGGNPLFVTELVAAPAGRLPRSIKDAVVSRVGELSPGDAEVVRTLAVVPARVERKVAEVLCGACDDSLAAAEHRGILAGDATHIWFRHELVRQAVEDTLSSSERVRVHRRMARHLQDQGEDPATVVHHAARCADVDLLLVAGPAAAHHAIAAGAHRQAVQHIDTVLHYGERLPIAVRADLLTLRSHSLYVVNRFQAALASAQEAVALSRQHGDREQLARALIALARATLWAVGPESSRRASEQALAVLEPDGSIELQAVAHADLARAVGDLASVGSVAQANPVAIEHAERALRLAEELDRSELRGYALIYLGTARLGAGDARGAADLAGALDLLRQSPRAELPVRACVNASGAAYRAGRFDDAERYVEEGLQLAKGAEFFSGAYRLGLTRASVRVSKGQWRDAELELRSLLAADGEPGIMEPLARCLLARVLARRGADAEARQLVASARETSPGPAEPRVVGPVAIAAVECAWLAGDEARLAESAQLAGPALAAAVETGNHVIAAELARYLRWAGLGAPDVPQAPEPWASSLRGDWSAAAAQWQRRGEPYEEALDLLSGGDPAARTRAVELLRSLGAEGTLAAVTGDRIQSGGP